MKVRQAHCSLKIEMESGSVFTLETVAQRACELDGLGEYIAKKISEELSKIADASQYKASIAKLQGQVEALKAEKAAQAEAAVEAKRGPGRPKKSAVESWGE